MSSIKEPRTDPEAITAPEGPRIVVVDGGPYLCYGVTVEYDGQIYAPEGYKALALCACGLSSNRPFCDSSHKIINKPAGPVRP